MHDRAAAQLLIGFLHQPHLDFLETFYSKKCIPCMEETEQCTFEQ